MTESLENLRSRIAKIDSQIIQAIGERMYLSREIGQVKRAGRMDIEVKDVEEAVLSRAKSLGQESGLDEEFIENLFRLLIEHSKKEQQEETRG